LEEVVHQGPWTFRGWTVLVEDYDGREDPEKLIFSGLYVWAQIHGIPKLYRKTEVIDDLARRVGKAKETQMSSKLFHEGNYVRISYSGVDRYRKTLDVFHFSLSPR
jgi:hypothetical protein